MVFVVLKCAKSSLMCQKSQIWMLFLCFNARHPFPSWRSLIHIIYSRLEGKNSAAAVSKVQASIIQSKKRRDKHTHTHTQTSKIRSDQHIQNSNFRFKSRKKRTQGSERCCAPRSVYVDSDAVRLYLAGKASGWHAGVFSVDSDTRRCEWACDTIQNLI